MLSSVQTFFPSYQFWDRNHSPESPEYVFRDLGFALLILGGIPDFKETWGRDSGLKACAGCGILKITIGTYGISREFGWE